MVENHLTASGEGNAAPIFWLYRESGPELSTVISSKERSHSSRDGYGSGRRKLALLTVAWPHAERPQRQHGAAVPNATPIACALSRERRHPRHRMNDA
jgi:hypothetical protein